MALMEFREPNQVLWRGCRPGHNGTQLLKRGTATDATVVVYTVPAATTLYLTYASIGLTVAAAAGGYLAIRNDAAAVQLIPLRVLSAAGAIFNSISSSFWPPIEMLAGWDVVVFSGAAGFPVFAEIAGWVE